MDGPLVNHEQTNLNVKTAEGESALNLSYPDAKLVKLLLETGQLNLDQDKAVKNLVQNPENGTIQFELSYWLITMNSNNSVQSIKGTNTLFPPSNESDTSLTDIKEGSKFLSACKNGETELVRKCLDLFNTLDPILNRIRWSTCPLVFDCWIT